MRAWLGFIMALVGLALLIAGVLAFWFTVMGGWAWTLVVGTPALLAGVFLLED